MNKTYLIVIASIFLFVGMSLCSLLFYRLGRHKRENTDSNTEISGAIIGAVFALLGLLIAFTFSGAHSRFDARKQLLVQEVKAIEAAYLLVDLLPTSSQPVFREKFRAYTTSRAVFYEKFIDASEGKTEILRATALEKEIWNHVVALSKDSQNELASELLLPAPLQSRCIPPRFYGSCCFLSRLCAQD